MEQATQNATNNLQGPGSATTRSKITVKATTPGKNTTPTQGSATKIDPVTMMRLKNTQAELKTAQDKRFVYDSEGAPQTPETDYYKKYISDREAVLSNAQRGAASPASTTPKVSLRYNPQTGTVENF